jgi:glycosyltransferase involved in cell wall biosynthesis
MRILQISSARTYGGGERHLADLSRSMHERGHKVFAALRPTNEWRKYIDFLPAENILMVSIRNSVGIFSANRIAKFVRDNDIDIIHAHIARDYIPASIASALAKNAKFVLTRHVAFPLKPFNRFALKNVERVIGVSAGVSDELKRTFPERKIRTIPNGIEIENWLRNERSKLRNEFRSFHAIPDDVPLIGTVGELLPLKGQRDLILAANETIKQFPNARFLIAGKDNSLDKGFRRELKRLADVFGISDNFLWLDWVEDTSMLYSALDLFVSPSHSESFGLSMLEAIISETPVVATDTAGARELQIAPENIVAVNDPLALSIKINEVIADLDGAFLRAKQARAKAAQDFSLTKMADRTEALYNELFPTESISVKK